MLPADPNIYGLGEHSETLRLPTNITRTLWARDSFGIPRNSNLYGVHPVYLEHRHGTKGGSAHGVFLLNSNGMDVVLSPGGALEYRVIGGVLDLYFFSGGAAGDPRVVAAQYAGVAGTPAMTPYWNLGFHQCRWGYRDWAEVAEVVANYSAAGIPLETMWTDIDYMDERKVFTLDPGNFPLQRMKQIRRVLRERGQKYIMMVDPAVAKRPYPTYERGVSAGAFMKHDDGSDYDAVVWPGVALYPDWFAPNTSAWWAGEFERFFGSGGDGVEIDGVWIDMNEPTNFCDYPCVDPAQTAKDRGMPPPNPPVRSPPRPIPGFDNTASKRGDLERYSGARRDQAGLDINEMTVELQQRASSSGLNLTDPPYAIHNDWPNGISDRTADTSLHHANGLSEYDTHNLYGHMMSLTTHTAMLGLHPNLRPVIITRSTFAGAGSKVFKWLGDNVSTWEHYRNSIAHMLSFASIYQIPVVGSDICGFGGNTTVALCARWAMLGAFNPFFRNHNIQDSTVPQEFYRHPLWAEAAGSAIAIRYRLLDYLYTALEGQSRTGVPAAVVPLFMAFPHDKGLERKSEWQFMYGEAVMVAPVVEGEETGTAVDVVFPKAPGGWYDFYSLQLVSPGGETRRFEDVGFTTIPLFIRAGSILPLRTESAMTTTALRKKGFEVVVAVGGGTAAGELYIDDGESIVQRATPLRVQYRYQHGVFAAKATSGAKGGKDWKGVCLEKIVFAGVSGGKGGPKAVLVRGRKLAREKWSWGWEKRNKVLTVRLEGVNVGEEVEVRLG